MREPTAIVRPVSGGKVGVDVAPAGGGVVKVTLNGHKQVLGVEIDPEAVDPEDVEMLQDMVTAAFNEAMKKVDDLISQDLGKMTGGLNIPGLF